MIDIKETKEQDVVPVLTKHFVKQSHMFYAFSQENKKEQNTGHRKDAPKTPSMCV